MYIHKENSGSRKAGLLCLVILKLVVVQGVYGVVDVKRGINPVLNPGIMQNSAIIGAVNEGDFSANDDNKVNNNRLPAEKTSKNNNAGLIKTKTPPPKTVAEGKKITDGMRTKLKEGFRQGEIFHETWFNRSPGQVKASLQKLTKFCNIACTRFNCREKDIANNCHLICPESCTQDCPDPLNEGAEKNFIAPEIIEGINGSEKKEVWDNQEAPLPNKLPIKYSQQKTKKTRSGQ